MRERVGHGEVGSDTDRSGGGRSAGEVRPPWVARPRGWRVARRRTPGPHPVRPAVAAGSVRPAEVPRPAGPGRTPQPWWAGPAGPRVLHRAGRRCANRYRLRRWAGRYRLRRAVASAALVLAAGAAVVGLGLLASLAAPDPTGAGGPGAAPVPVVVTVAPGETVWEVADRVAPGLPGAQRAALAERIVAENALDSARPPAGLVLRVPVG